MGSGWDTDHCASDSGYFCSVMDQMDKTIDLQGISYLRIKLAKNKFTCTQINL